MIDLISCSGVALKSPQLSDSSDEALGLCSDDNDPSPSQSWCWCRYVQPENQYFNFNICGPLRELWRKDQQQIVYWEWRNVPVGLVKYQYILYNLQSIHVTVRNSLIRPSKWFGLYAKCASASSGRTSGWRITVAHPCITAWWCITAGRSSCLPNTILYTQVAYSVKTLYKLATLQELCKREYLPGTLRGVLFPQTVCIGYTTVVMITIYN